MPLHPPCPTCKNTGIVSAKGGDDAVALCPGDLARGEVPCPYASEVERGLVAESPTAIPPEERDPTE